MTDHIPPTNPFAPGELARLIRSARGNEGAIVQITGAPTRRWVTLNQKGSYPKYHAGLTECHPTWTYRVILNGEETGAPHDWLERINDDDTDRNTVTTWDDCVFKPAKEAFE